MHLNAAACFQNNNNTRNEDRDANTAAAAAVVVPKKMTLPLENDLPNPNFVVRLRRDDDDDVNQESAKEEEGSDEKDNGEEGDKPESFLKSILLDRMTRKRSFGEDETPYMVKKSGGEVSHCPTVPKVAGSPTVPKVPGSPAKPPAEDCNDILRRRLLGLKDPNYDLMQRQKKQPQRPPQPQPQRVEVKEARAEEMKGVDHEEVVRTLEDKAASAEEDLGEDDAPQAEVEARPQTDYSHTSVLKHLLHRYTGSDNSGEDDGGADGGKPSA